jgi:hypothetical protein
MNQTATLSPSHEERLIEFKETAHLLGDISERSVRRLISREIRSGKLLRAHRIRIHECQRRRVILGNTASIP